MRIPVLTAAAGAGWEAALVLAAERDGLGFVVVRRCVDLVELLAVAAAGQARVALIDAALPRLDPTVVERLEVAGVAAVGVVPARSSRDPDESVESAAVARLAELGITTTIPADADAAVIGAVIEQALRGAVVPGRSDTLERTWSDPARATGTVVPPTIEPVPVAPLVARGSVIGVWGPTGAPGRTTLAVTVADELARLGARVLLADLDVYGGVVAAVLGLLDESPGIAAACRLAAAGRLDAAGLAGLAWQLGDQLRVLTGIPRADRWPELRPAAVTSVIETGRSLADFSVLDLGFSVEQDEELAYDTAAPRRNGATLAALDAADVVLVVGSADPIGVQRLVRALAELREAAVDTPVWIVLNRVRPGAVPGDARAELGQAVVRFTGQEPAAFLPADPAGLDAALAVGRTLGEVRPSSPYRRAVVELAASLAGITIGRGGKKANAGRDVPTGRGRRGGASGRR